MNGRQQPEKKDLEQTGKEGVGLPRAQGKFEDKSQKGSLGLFPDGGKKPKEQVMSKRT